MEVTIFALQPAESCSEGNADHAGGRATADCYKKVRNDLYVVLETVVLTDFAVMVVEERNEILCNYSPLARCLILGVVEFDWEHGVSFSASSISHFTSSISTHSWTTRAYQSRCHREDAASTS